MRKAWMAAVLACAVVPLLGISGDGAKEEENSPSAALKSVLKGGRCDGRCSCACDPKGEKPEAGACKACGVVTACGHRLLCDACVEKTREPLACLCDGEHDHPSVEHSACPYCLKIWTGQPKAKKR